MRWELIRADGENLVTENTILHFTVPCSISITSLGPLLSLARFLLADDDDDDDEEEEEEEEEEEGGEEEEEEDAAEEKEEEEAAEEAEAAGLLSLPLPPLAPPLAPPCAPLPPLSEEDEEGACFRSLSSYLTGFPFFHCPVQVRPSLSVRVPCPSFSSCL